jgi:NAD(P)-dependent dehydrogenase (short-subunit alcohol dehydrogenase family)/uncharacterized OB-fold protein
MTTKPKRKNPILRTRQATLPPAARSRVMLGMTAGAAAGLFELQVCEQCGTVQYPAREVCRNCLSDQLPWRPQSGDGELISETISRTSQELYYRERTPWRFGMVRLAAGPTVVAHVHAACPQAPAAVRVEAILDRSGQPALVAMPRDKDANLNEDPHLRDMTCDPKNRKILVTDGKSAVGQALVRALAEAGAELIWAGNAEPWKKPPGFAALSELPQVTIMPLDVTDSRSVIELAAEIGGKVDIVINTADYHRTFGIAARHGVETAQAEMDINYFGFLRLAQSFGPVLRARAADGKNNAVAWVNLLSVYALSNFPPHGTYSASQAAALSLAQCLRAEMRPAGIRVINVFSGPINDDWNQLMLPPKLEPAALARAVIGALKTTVEDAFPGDVAQDWLARWRQDPKTLERELMNATPSSAG